MIRRIAAALILLAAPASADTVGPTSGTMTSGTINSIGAGSVCMFFSSGTVAGSAGTACSTMPDITFTMPPEWRCMDFAIRGADRVVSLHLPSSSGADTVVRIDKNANYEHPKEGYCG